jgi:hypothetical protein
MTVAGFPHSGITGSQPACGSPMLFAAYHALHRLSVPRHPPCALVRLTGISAPLRPSINRATLRYTPRRSLRRTTVRLGRASSCASICTISLRPGRREILRIRFALYFLHTHTQIPERLALSRKKKARLPGALPRPFTQPSTHVVKK